MTAKSSAAGQSGPTTGAIGPDTYARWRATRLGAVTEALEHRLVSDLVGHVSGKRLLDLGCGDGLLTCRLATPGAWAVGIDADDRMLAAARARASRGGVNARFVQSRIEQLPLPDASFDVVVAVTVFCFLTDRAAAMTEAVRVLRPGGRFVLAELGRWSAWAAIRRIRAWLGAPTWRAAHFWTAAELCQMVEHAGVSVDAVSGSVYYPPVEWAAALLAPFDRRLGPLTTGAAFIAVAGTKTSLE